MKYGGVVNGIDYDVWNPEIDHHIPVRYGLDTPSTANTTTSGPCATA
jgi:glycogen synthase